MTDLTVTRSRYADRWVVVTGIRDLDYTLGKGTVVHKLGEIVWGHPIGVVFGGARGVDTVALRAAWLARGGPDGMPLTRFVVVVPGTVEQQPRGTQATTRECADEVIELRMPLHQPGSFHKRNERMLRLAEERSDGLPLRPICVGFTDDLDPRAGGTASCMSLARRLAIEVEHVPTPRVGGGVD